MIYLTQLTSRKFSFTLQCPSKCSKAAKELLVRQIIVSHSAHASQQWLPDPQLPVMYTREDWLRGRAWTSTSTGLTSVDESDEITVHYQGFNVQPAITRKETVASTATTANLQFPGTLVCVLTHPATHRMPLVDDTQWYKYSEKKNRFPRFHKRWKDVKTQIRWRLDTSHGEQLLAARQQTWHRHDPVTADALCRSSFASTWALTGTAFSNEQLFHYRLKIGGFNRYRRDSSSNPTCPLNNCHQEEEDTLAHIFWTCGMARRMWRAVLQLWTHELLGNENLHEFQAPVFAGKPPRAPVAILPWLLHHVHQIRPDHRLALERVWSCICTTTLRQLWRFRCEECFQDTSRSIFEKIGITIKRVQDNLQVLEALARTKRNHDEITIYSLAHKYMEDPQLTRECRFYTEADRRERPTRLHYDGGDFAARERRMAACVDRVRLLGAHGTNNVAEYEALLLELMTNKQRRNKSLTIIGDSNLIKTQVLGLVAVRTKTLMTQFTRARDLLKRLRHYQIHHTFRTHNKVADFLANVAMDQRDSSKDDIGVIPTLADLEGKLLPLHAQDLLFDPDTAATRTLPSGSASTAEAPSSRRHPPTGGAELRALSRGRLGPWKREARRQGLWVILAGFQVLICCSSSCVVAKKKILLVSADTSIQHGYMFIRYVI